jgi:hypothetical protein
MRMTIVGSNPRSGGSECIIFGHFGRDDHRFAPVGAAEGDGFSAHGEWEVRPMRPGAGLETAPALVGSLAKGGYGRTTGRLVLVSHNWSGKLQINNIGRRYTIDLYSPQTRLVLLDVVHEIMVDVTPLAALDNGVLALPALPVATIFEHIVEADAWFRFVDRDADFRPDVVRRAMEACRPQPTDALKLRLMSALLPKLAARAVVPLPPPPAPETPLRLRDDLRLLAAAVDGLALRARA